MRDAMMRKWTIALGIIAAVLAEAAVVTTYLRSGHFDVTPFGGGLLCAVIALLAARGPKSTSGGSTR